MKSIFELASGPLSHLPSNTIHLDPIMKGEHVDPLSIMDSESMERTALSVLTDLMDENPEDLNLQEFYHVWLYVKIASYGGTLTLTAPCPRTVRIPVPENKTFIERACGATLRTSINLNESDVKRCPASYEIPKVTINLEGEEKAYSLIPPTMTDELNLISWFQEKGYSRKQLVATKGPDRAISTQYSKHRVALHFCREGSKEPAFRDHALREQIVDKLLHELTLPELSAITMKVNEEASFGVVFHSGTAVCPVCKATVKIPLPLSAGLVV